MALPPAARCDYSDKPVEWEKPDEADCVPRLECQSAGGSKVVLTEPSAIFRTILEVWGEGRLQGDLPAVGKLRRGQLIDEAWAKYVRPICYFVLECCWHGIR